ncbi:hypothetical protein B0H11DRAFT_1925165 [Mycena galericulata]|nr:hypothetical protein B0H11DRAFT_1925165 [Mycena galericulata]
MARKRSLQDLSSSSGAASGSGEEFQPSDSEIFPERLVGQRNLRQRNPSTHRVDPPVDPHPEPRRKSKSRKVAAGTSASDSRSKSARGRSPSMSSRRRADSTASTGVSKTKGTTSFPSFYVAVPQPPYFKGSKVPKSESASSKPAPAAAPPSKKSVPKPPPEPLHQPRDPSNLPPDKRFLCRDLPPSGFRLHDINDAVFDFEVDVVKSAPYPPEDRSTDNLSLYFRAQFRESPELMIGSDDTFSAPAFWDSKEGHFIQTALGGSGRLTGKRCFRWVRSAFNTIDAFVKAYPLMPDYPATEPLLNDPVFDDPRDPAPQFKQPPVTEPQKVEVSGHTEEDLEEMQRRNDEFFSLWQEQSREALQAAQLRHRDERNAWGRRRAQARTAYIRREAHRSRVVADYLERRDEALTAMSTEVIIMAEFAIWLEDWDQRGYDPPVMPPMSRSASPVTAVSTLTAPPAASSSPARPVSSSNPGRVSSSSNSGPVASSSKTVPVASSSKTALSGRRSVFTLILSLRVDPDPIPRAEDLFNDEYEVPPIDVERSQSPSGDEDDDNESDEDEDELMGSDAAVDELDPSRPPSVSTKAKGKGKETEVEKGREKAVAKPKAKKKKKGSRKFTEEELKTFIPTPSCFANFRHKRIHPAFYSSYHLNEPLSWEPPMRDAPRGGSSHGTKDQVRVNTHGWRWSDIAGCVGVAQGLERARIPLTDLPMLMFVTRGVGCGQCEKERDNGVVCVRTRLGLEMHANCVRCRETRQSCSVFEGYDFELTDRVISESNRFIFEMTIRHFTWLYSDVLDTDMSSRLLGLALLLVDQPPTAPIAPSTTSAAKKITDATLDVPPNLFLKSQLAATANSIIGAALPDLPPDAPLVEQIERSLEMSRASSAALQMVLAQMVRPNSPRDPTFPGDLFPVGADGEVMRHAEGGDDEMEGVAEEDSSAMKVDAPATPAVGNSTASMSVGDTGAPLHTHPLSLTGVHGASSVSSSSSELARALGTPPPASVFRDFRGPVRQSTPGVVPPFSDSPETSFAVPLRFGTPGLSLRGASSSSTIGTFGQRAHRPSSTSPTPVPPPPRKSPSLPPPS